MVRLPRSASAVYRFGEFRLEVAAYRLVRADKGQVTAVPLARTAFEILLLLVRNPGRIITTEEFLSQIWPRTYVQPEGLKSQIMQLRTALGDRASPHVYVETVRGRGYRFIGELHPDPAVPLKSEAVGRARQLAGRDMPRARIDELFRATSTDGAQIVFLVGEAGIGKSALALDFLKAASGVANSAQGRCLPGGGQGDPYHPVLEVLSELVRNAPDEDVAATLGSLAPAWLKQLPGLAGGGAADSVFLTSTYHLTAEICAALEAIARTTSLVLVIEDLQWSDPSTLDLIRAIASRRLGARLLLILTVRTASIPTERTNALLLSSELMLHGMSHEIVLDTLDESGVENVVRWRSGYAPDAKLVRLLRARSGGNPLFLNAIIDHLEDHRLFDAVGIGWGGDIQFDAIAEHVPHSLQQTINADIDLLDADAQRILEAASVSAEDFSPYLHHESAGVSEQHFEDVCEVLSRSSRLIERSEELVFPNGAITQRYRFRHALLRDVALSRQGPLRKARASAAVAARLTNAYSSDLSPVAITLARHLQQAHDWQGAVRFLQLAGNVALRRSARTEATQLMEEALALCSRLTTEERPRGELSILDQLAQIYGGKYDERAIGLFRRILSVAESSGLIELQCRVLIGMSFPLSWNDLPAALEVLERAITLTVDIADPVRRAAFRAVSLSWRVWIGGWNADDVTEAEEAIRVIRREGTEADLHTVLMYYSLILFVGSRYRDGASLVQSASISLLADQKANQANLALAFWFARCGVPWALIFAGEYGYAMETFERSSEAFLSDGDPYSAVALRILRAFYSALFGEIKAAADDCRRIAAEVETHCLSLHSGQLRNTLITQALIATSLEKHEDALALFAGVRLGMAERPALFDWYWRMPLEWGETRARIALGAADDASEAAERLRSYASLSAEKTWRCLSTESGARVAMLRGDFGEARRLIDEGWREIEGVEAPFAKLMLLEAEADLGGPDAERNRSEAAGIRKTMSAFRPMDENEVLSNAALDAILP